jgi:hypothetical protein
MKFIKPSEISGKIMTLIEECDEKLILISPYIKIAKWYKLLNKIKELKSRNINYQIFVREDNSNIETYNELQTLGLSYSTIPNLHAKLYMNEKYAIVTSMNLLLSSEINSLEIGYITETAEEYNELVGFVERFIKSEHKNNVPINKSDKEKAGYYELSGMIWQDRFCELISRELNQNIEAWPDKGSIRIKTKTNNYQCFISNSNKINNLRLSGILSGKEYEEFNKIYDQLEKDTKLKIELTPFKNGYHSMIWGELSGINSRDIFYLNQIDERKVVEAITKFVVTVDKLKEKLRHS